MEILLYTSIAWLTVTTLILIRNWFEFKGLSDVPLPTSKSGLPVVSICIPARNEENVIERCVTSALKQNYPHFEVLILDDNSTDKTALILEELSGIIANVHLIKGKQKPDDWLGKSWACHQLSEQAKGEFLFFIDADVWLEEDALSKAVAAIGDKDAITIWPKQHFGSFWERMAIPVIYHTLFSLLPVKYAERTPKWLPKRFHEKLDPQFAAACGQFIAFKKYAYKIIGGHESVKNQVVEDVELARELRKNNFRLGMFHGAGTVHCRMYEGHSELWNGLRKNFFAGFGRNLFTFVLMGLLHLLVFVLPFFVFLYSFWFVNQQLLVLSGAAASLVFLQRLVLDIRFRWNPLVSLLHPVSVLWFQALGLRCISDYLSGTKASWKGRNL